MLFFVVLAIIFIDQLAKYSILIYARGGFFVIPQILSLEIHKNPGVAFGLALPESTIIILITIILSSLVWCRYKKRKVENFGLGNIGFGLIIGGAISNLIDRLRFSYIIDFINLRPWSVFNIADVAIVVGVILLAWNVLFRRSHTKQEI